MTPTILNVILSALAVLVVLGSGTWLYVKGWDWAVDRDWSRGGCHAAAVAAILLAPWWVPAYLLLTPERWLRRSDASATPNMSDVSRGHPHTRPIRPLP